MANREERDKWLAGEAQAFSSVLKALQLKKGALSNKDFCLYLGISETALRELKRAKYSSPDLLLDMQRFLRSSPAERASQNWKPAPVPELSAREKRFLKLKSLIARIFTAVPNSISPVDIIPGISLKMGDVDSNGLLNVRFEILEGDLTSSSYHPKRFHMKWLETPFVPPSEVLLDTWTAVFSVQYEHWRRTNHGIHFRPLARVAGYNRTNGQFHLKLQLTSYAHFAATNLNLNSYLGRHIRSLNGDRMPAIGCKYLACPLNVIVMIVSEDNKTFVALRNKQLFERPLTWQASVGGAVELSDTTLYGAISREIFEEMGLKVQEDEVSCLAVGINQVSFEPDVIALVRSRKNSKHVQYAFEKYAERKEFDEFETWHLEENQLDKILATFVGRVWSQPSDEAAVLMTLFRIFGRSAMKKALSRLPFQVRRPDQECYFHMDSKRNAPRTEIIST